MASTYFSLYDFFFEFKGQAVGGHAWEPELSFDNISSGDSPENRTTARRIFEARAAKDEKREGGGCRHQQSRTGPLHQPCSEAKGGFPTNPVVSQIAGVTEEHPSCQAGGSERPGNHRQL